MGYTATFTRSNLLVRKDDPKGLFDLVYGWGKNNYRFEGVIDDFKREFEAGNLARAFCELEFVSRMTPRGLHIQQYTGDKWGEAPEAFLDLLAKNGYLVPGQTVDVSFNDGAWNAKWGVTPKGLICR
jgi:hypothetical protein